MKLDSETNKLEGLWKYGWNLMAWFGIVCAFLIMIGIMLIKFYLPHVMIKMKEDMQIQQENNASNKTNLRFYDWKQIHNLENIIDLYIRTRDSIVEEIENEFVDDIPQGSITIWITADDSIAVDLRYNLDCNCPLEENQFNYLCFSVDLNNPSGQPSILDKFLYEGISKERYPIITSKKGGVITKK